MTPSPPSVATDSPSAGFSPARRRQDLTLLAGLAGTSLLLASCSRARPPEAELPKPPPAPAAGADRPAPATAVEAGFTPLPSTTQVLAANAIGRSDPFASNRPVVAVRPDGSTGAGTAGRPAQPPRPAPLQLPPGFRFSGVISTGYAPQALVQYGASSGSVGIGELGGRNTDLLPAGWVVSSIDINRGRLVLRRGGQTVTAEL